MLVNNEAMLERTVIDIPDVAWDLIDLAQKPLTIIYEKVKGIAPNAIPKNNSCAIRLVKDEFCRQLINRFKNLLLLHQQI